MVAEVLQMCEYVYLISLPKPYFKVFCGVYGEVWYIYEGEVLVPARGVEPPTFALRMRCSTN